MVVFNIQNNEVIKGKSLKNSDPNSEESEIHRGNQEDEKIKTCYTCGKKFDMNKEDGSRYRYGKFPLCAYCVEFYGFYFDDPGQKRREK